MDDSSNIESVLRLSTYIGVIVLMALLEALMPRRQRSFDRVRRWFANLGLIAISTVLVRFAVPLMATGIAMAAEEKGWGIFNLLSLPHVLNIVLSLMLLDMMIYWQHVATHYVPFLWALHKVHHSDRDIDVTTGIRFHPIEIVLSLFYKFLCIIIIGPSATAVLIFEIALNASSMFNHANLRLPLKLDYILRKLIVTPDMHRVHHSVLVRETNSNFGFNLALWDRIFGTYISQPQSGHISMRIGLEEYQDEKPSSLPWCIVLPFLRRPSKLKHHEN